MTSRTSRNTPYQETTAVRNAQTTQQQIAALVSKRQKLQGQGDAQNWRQCASVTRIETEIDATNNQIAQLTYGELTTAEDHWSRSND
jgi:hypothetical protein